MSGIQRVLVTGGAGYVGAVLVPALLDVGHEVVSLDTHWYGKDVLDAVAGDERLEILEGDIRDPEMVRKAMAGCDAVIHLAAISNDPSADLDEVLTKEVNLDAVKLLVDEAVSAGVKRFVNISSSSVYGVREEQDVTEDLELLPLTIYSRCKCDAEEYVRETSKAHSGFVGINLRPATVCGWSPRLRLDLTVNILTMHAWRNGVITVFGGAQKRPNIHIADVVEAYVQSLGWPAEVVDGEAFNIGYENHTVMEIAEMVRSEFADGEVDIIVTDTNDPRSYHISSEKISRLVGFEPRHTLRDAVRDLKGAFDSGSVQDWDDTRYYNVKHMLSLGVGEPD